MCNCEKEYNPDKDITLYRTFELESMLRARREGTFLNTVPPFTDDELIEELENRLTQ